MFVYVKKLLEISKQVGRLYLLQTICLNSAVHYHYEPNTTDLDTKTRKTVIFEIVSLIVYYVSYMCLIMIACYFVYYMF